MVVSAPWLTLTIVLIAYIATFPFGAKSYHLQQAKAPKPPKNNARPDSEQEIADE